MLTIACCLKVDLGLDFLPGLSMVMRTYLYYFLLSLCCTPSDWAAVLVGFGSMAICWLGDTLLMVLREQTQASTCVTICLTQQAFIKKLYWCPICTFSEDLSLSC